MPLHDNVKAATVLANDFADDKSLNQRIGVVEQDLRNWHFYAVDQRDRMGHTSKFIEKYAMFKGVVENIDALLAAIRDISQFDATNVAEFETKAVEIFWSIQTAAHLHRDKGVKGFAKITLFRQPQSAIDFDRFYSAPSYRS